MNHYRERLLAADFFVVETIWLKTLYCFFFIELGTRRVYLAGITDHPNGHWTTQQARNTVWLLEERDIDFIALIRDNDSKYTESFDTVFESEDINIIRTPYRAPNANDYASCCTSMERFGMTSRGWGRELSLHPCCLVGTASPVGSSYRYSGFSE